MADAEFITRCLDVIEQDVVPRTAEGVRHGNKLFGAAILRRDDLSLVVAETNNETENPLWHGEVHAIKRFYELDRAGRPNPPQCVFLATHEPCSLCLSAITWSGFDNFSYLFSHQDSADSFAIPYDIAILKAVYAVPDPDRDVAPAGRDLYNRVNEYFASTDLAAGIKELEPDGGALTDRVGSLARIYAQLSDVYQSGKGGDDIPLA